MRDRVPGLDSLRVDLSRGRTTAPYEIRLHERLTVRDLVTGQRDVPILHLARSVSPRAASVMRDARVPFVDLAGNAFLSFGDVLVDVRGLRPDRTSSGATSRESGNIFSTARAKVVFALLTWPTLREATRREVAQAAGVSVGQAQNAVTLLLDLDLDLTPSSPDRLRLLDLWATAFPGTLGRTLTVGRYNGALEHIDTGADEVYLSGEAAASTLLRPASCVLYAREPSARMAVLNRWRSDGPSTITVRRAFWSVPPAAPPAQPIGARGICPAPWTLVYADLLASTDPRVRGVATQWRDLHA